MNGKTLDQAAEEIAYELGLTPEDNPDEIEELYKALEADGYRN